MNNQVAYTYKAFLARKHVRNKQCGIDVPPSKLNPKLKDWQALLTRWALRCGRAALFEGVGLGKTFQQLTWAEHIVAATNSRVILFCPLAVQRQTSRESEKFNIGVAVKVVESQAEVAGPGIYVTNYDKLHLFDASQFVGVVLDESSILKSFTGATKRELCKSFAGHQYKLACTATPSPNDLLELGNQSEFLGVMPSNEMIARWFINDGKSVGKYHLRGHGAKDYWRWVASWAACISSPADIGYDSTGYTLPPLNAVEHVIESRVPAGMLFNAGNDSISATEVHREKRDNLQSRADVAADLANGNDESWVVWVDTDYEADALAERIPDAVEVRGSMPNGKKLELLESFSSGESRVIVTKSRIAGYGLNWQHCHNMTWFAGYSWEQFHQAIGRLRRFGQTKVVNVHIVRTENEGSIVETIRRKEKQNVEMQSEVAMLMRDGMCEELGLGVELKKYNPTKKTRVPKWLQTKQEM